MGKKSSFIRTSSLFQRNHEKRHLLKRAGEIPGKPVHTGMQRIEDVKIKIHDYGEEHYSVIPIDAIEQSAPYIEDSSKTWVQVEGLHRLDRIQSIWNYFGLHPLIQEDIVNVVQRPKIETYQNHLFIVLRLITPDSSTEEKSSFHSEQISFVLGKNYVISFQESDEPIFASIFKRLEQPATRLRKHGVDFLAYALLDTVVDHYFHSLELFGLTIDRLEEEIIENPGNHYLHNIHNLRRDAIQFRKSVWSLRDGVNSLIRDDNPMISSEVKIFLRDVYDHVVQVIDSIEAYREMIYSLYDMYMSTLSNRMNEVMKVLTIIATIFIPLTFVAGIYGMNFDPEISPFNMPELNWYYGYPFSLLIMIAISLTMIYYFRRKNWF
jgi:magnesium transporter